MFISSATITAKTQAILVFFSGLGAIVIADTAKPIFIILLLVCIDFITGLIRSKYLGHEITSRKMSKKFLKFSGQAAMIYTSAIVAFMYPQAHFFTNAIIIYFIGMEVISIRENINQMGIGLPPEIEDKIDKFLNLKK